MADVLALIDRPVEPGLVPRGFAEEVLTRAAAVEDPEVLWNGATTLAGLAQKWNGHGQEKNEIKAAQMFCEIQLGHVLGPNPERGPGRGHKESRAIVLDGLIPQPRISELQRFYGWRDALLEEVRNGHRSRRSLLLLVDQWAAAERPEPVFEELDIRYGDFRDTLAFVDPGSVARHFCVDCEREMIHRDNRAGYESSSAIGQIISRDGPRSNHFGGGDIDFYWHERRRPQGSALTCSARCMAPACTAWACCAIRPWTCCFN
jgi:hypothetical protein